MSATFAYFLFKLLSTFIVLTVTSRINSMTNSTFRAYPYVPTFWRDQEDQLRLTLTVTESTILSAFLAVIITYALGRLVAILFTLLYISLFYRKARTLIDDQVVTIGSNIDNSFQLVFYLCRYAFRLKRRAFVSTVFRILFLTALAYFTVQQVVVYFLGHLILIDPVPISPGTCGIPNITASVGKASPQSVGHTLQLRNNLLERAATQFVACRDTGSKITCPGPADQMFSWDVVESEPGHCWFGPEHCYNGSRTISQRATLVPSDLGTIRKSPLSLTVMAECSHVNNSDFSIIQYDPELNSSFYALQFGSSPRYSFSNLYENDTFVVYEVENIHPGYHLEFEGFNLRPDIYNWTPPLFLSSNLNNPFFTDNTTAPSTLYLLFNRLYGLASYFPNTDPFFLTEENPSSGHLYDTGRIVSTMACRDRFELNIKLQDGLLNATRIATGQFSYIADMFSNYTAKDSDMTMDMLLFVGALYPSVFTIALTQLTGNTLIAGQTVFGNTQFGDPRNVSTRTEVTRWFGVAMLTALNIAQFYTSSNTDNEWEYGIVKLPNTCWFCDKTLRIDPLYVSVYMRTLLLILFGVLAVSLLAYFLDWLLLHIAKVFLKSSICNRIDGIIKSKNLHSFLQLHRIGVEATSDQTFLETQGEIPVLEGRDSGMAPRYNLRMHDVEESISPENCEKGDLRA